MGRISSSLSGIERRLLYRLAEAEAAANLSSLRLAAGRRILKPRDDPSGFVTLGRYQRQFHGLTTALANVTAASTIASGVDLTLDQIRGQLDLIRTKALADQDLALAPDQRVANQLAIDAAVAQIRALVATSFSGKRVLDGSASFRIQGRNSAQVLRLEVYALGDGQSATISGTITAAATRATLTRSEATGTVTSGDASIALAGRRGETVIEVSDGESLADLAAKVNLRSHLTGVVAAVADGTDLIFTSVDDGSSASVTITVLEGSFAVNGGDGNGSDTGTDATAVINGQALTGVGSRFTANIGGLSFLVEAEAGFVGAIDPIQVGQGGLQFALTSDAFRTTTLALPGLQPELLGGPSGNLAQLASGEAASGLGANASLALRIVDEARGMLDRIGGLVAGFSQAAVDSSAALLTALRTDAADALVAFDGIDREAEESRLARFQTLASFARSGLLLAGQQRAAVVRLIEHLAGLR